MSSALCRCGRAIQDGIFCPECGLAATSCDCAALVQPEDPFSHEEMAELLAAFFGTDKPLLMANDPDLEAISSAAWDVLRQTNINPVVIFRMGSVPSRLEFDDDGAPVVRPLTVERLRQEMAARALWYRSNGPRGPVGREAVRRSRTTRTLGRS